MLKHVQMPYGLQGIRKRNPAGLLRADLPLPGGLRLTMPAAGGGLRLESATHLVGPGDLPSTLALAHDTTPWAVALANGLRFPYLLPTGQTLVIPEL